MPGSATTRDSNLRDGGREWGQERSPGPYVAKNGERVSGLTIQFPFHFDPAIDVCRRYLEQDMAGSQLSASFRAYYLLRRFIPLAVRQRLQHWRNRNLCQSGDWYIPHQFRSDLAAAVQNAHETAVCPWPGDADFAFVLTHDVETAAGLGKIDAIATIEEQLGFRSSWNIVPYKYAIDEGLIDDLRQRGFEIGIHGYNHDGKLFWSEATFQRRVPLMNAAIERYRAVGFRAPMTHRNLKWMQQLNIEYDASCFDVDPFQAMPGGIGSPWPLVVGKFVELPYTLPQDHTLLIGLGETTDRIWREKLKYIKAMSGMALMLTHPDYLNTASRLDIYKGFLEQVRDAGGYWHALPQTLARWWRDGRQIGSGKTRSAWEASPATTSVEAEDVRKGSGACR